MVNQATPGAEHRKWRETPRRERIPDTGYLLVTSWLGSDAHEPLDSVWAPVEWMDENRVKGE